MEELKDEDKFIVFSCAYKSGDRTIINVRASHSMPVKNMAHILAGGISVLIKGCNKSDLGIKDHELLEEIINHLKTDFTSIDSFEDANIIRETDIKNNQN